MTQLEQQVLEAKALTIGNPMFSVAPHYKNPSKTESYSVKGFGNGFVSAVDRFTGVNEAKFTFKQSQSETIFAK